MSILQSRYISSKFRRRIRHCMTFHTAVQVSPDVTPQQKSVNAPTKFTGAPMGTCPTITEATPSHSTSGKAIVSLVCSIVGCFFFGLIYGPIAICLAVAAMNEIKEQPPDRFKGKCMATSGLILGIIGFIGSIIVSSMYYFSLSTCT
jgi:Domain of unknown function (DUF4190)